MGAVLRFVREGFRRHIKQSFPFSVIQQQQQGNMAYQVES